MAIIAYLRVSTADQNLARQEEMAREVKADKVFSEKSSGKNAANRPQLAAVLDYVREGDTLHVESISRLARSTRDLLDIVDKLTAKGVQFVSHKENIDTTTPTGRFVLTVFAAIAELEREAIALRRNEGIAAAKREGRNMGRPRAAVPKNFDSIANDYKQGAVTGAEAARRAGMSRSTFHRTVSRRL